MKPTCNKVTCTIGAIIAAIVAIICLVPLKSFKACKEACGEHSYWDHIKDFWQNKLKKGENVVVKKAPESKELAEDKPDTPASEGKLYTVDPAEKEELVDEDTLSADLSNPESSNNNSKKLIAKRTQQ